MEFIYKNKLNPVDIEQIQAFYNGLALTTIEQHPLWHLEVDIKNVIYFIAYENNEIVCYSVLYEKRLGPVKFANIRYGPLFKDREYLLSALTEIISHYKKRRFLYISIQLAMFTGTDTDYIEAKLYQVIKFKNSFDRNNWSSIIVKLEEDEESILKGFRTNHLRSLKKAVKANAVARQAESRNDMLYLADVYHKMQLARKINTESKAEIESQFIRLYDFITENNTGFVIIVTDATGEITGGTINLFQGKGVRYFKGAANPHKKEIPVLHSAIFEGIKVAKSMGFQYLDLWGYNHYVDQDDQVYNINQFKKGFGGEFVFYPKIMQIQLLPMGRLIYNVIKGLKEKGKRIFSR